MPGRCRAPELKAKTTNFGIHGNWFIPTGGKVLPYLGAGVGYYSRKPEIKVTSGGSSASFTVKPTD